MTDTVADEAPAPTEAPPPPPGPSRRDPATVAAWLLLAVLTVLTCWGTLTHDYREEPLVGDQASQLLQAESLAYDDHNLSYDEEDLTRFTEEELRWESTPHPSGLFFQRTEDGWAFAKPYGYSVVLAPFLRLLGPAAGAAVTNTLLLLTVEGLVLALLLLRLRGPSVPLVTAGVVLVSNTVTYAYPLMVELFTAALVGTFLYGTLRGLRDQRLLWSLVGFAVAGAMLAEKAPLIAVVAPVAAVALALQAGWWRRALLVGTMVAAFVVGVVPYLVYSDGQSFSAYRGERFYAAGAAPFGDAPAPLVRTRTDETFSPGYVRSAVTSGWDDKAVAAFTYVFGRHTGLLVFMPVAVVVLALALLRLRRADAVGLAVLASTLAFVVLYVVLFPRNYYGGGQAFGNRYFVQVCPLVAALASTFRLPSRQLVLGSVGALIFGAVTLWPHLTDPEEALVRLQVTTPVQRLFPFEERQEGGEYFRCGRAYCREGGGPAVGGSGLAGGGIGRYVRSYVRFDRDRAANPPVPAAAPTTTEPAGAPGGDGTSGSGGTESTEGGGN